MNNEITNEVMQQIQNKRSAYKEDVVIAFEESMADAIMRECHDLSSITPVIPDNAVTINELIVRNGSVDRIETSIDYDYVELESDYIDMTDYDVKLVDTSRIDTGSIIQDIIDDAFLAGFKAGMSERKPITKEALVQAIIDCSGDTLDRLVETLNA